MKTIILDARQVGETLAENLIVVRIMILLSSILILTKLCQLQDKFDLCAILEHGSHPMVLRNSVVEDADILVVVTDSYETNMIACQIVYMLFKTPNCITCICSHDYICEAE